MKVSADHPLVVTYQDYERPSPNSLRKFQSLTNDTNPETERVIESICNQFIEAYVVQPGRK
jgi:hypothetical protein